MAEPKLTYFDDTDQFLRRVGFHDHFKRDVLLWKAFKDKDVQMSWTYRDARLMNDDGLDAYHAYFSERAAINLSAILWFAFFGLTKRIDPPLEPRPEPDPDDLEYGDLHCSTGAPRDKAHMELLAKLVNDGEYAGIARRYPKQVA